MSQEENLSHTQFGDHIRLFRGLNEVEPHEINTRGIGIHWTGEPNSASNFALNRDEWGYARESWDEDEPNRPDRGTVVEAMVHPDHIVQRGTPEHEELAGWANILHEGSFENETTVREGSPVHIVAHHYMEQGENHDVLKTQRFSPKKGIA